MGFDGSPWRPASPALLNEVSSGSPWRPAPSVVTGVSSDHQSPLSPSANGASDKVISATVKGASNNSPEGAAPPAVATEPNRVASSILRIVPQEGHNSQDNLYDPHRSDIDTALQHPIGFAGNLVIGGLSGAAFGGPIPWALNQAVDRMLPSPEAAALPLNPALRRTGILPDLWTDNINRGVAKIEDALLPKEGSLIYKGAKWYQANFDEKYLRSSDLTLRKSYFNALNDDVTNLMKTDAQAIEELLKKDPSALTASESTQLHQLYERKQVFLAPEWQERAKGAELLEQLHTQKIYNPTLFTDKELELLARRQESNVRAIEMTKAQLAFHDLSANFVRGAAIVGVAMMADHYLDKILTGNDHHQGLTSKNATESFPIVNSMTKSWNTNEFLLPMAFATGGFSKTGVLTTVGYTGAAILAGKFLDHVLPPSEHEEVSRYLRPTAVDATLIAGAFVLPARNKIAMVAGAWALGRIYNLFEGPANADVKDEAFDQMKIDMKDRTAASMNTAIDTFKNLGQKDDYALRLYVSDWLRPNRKYDGMLSAFRGAVILNDAFGESRLEKGTLIKGTTKDFILQDSNIDIGGQALRSLLIANINVDRAKQQTNIELGKTVQGSKVAQSDLTGLDEVGRRIDSTIKNKIYGKHDIPAVLSELADFYHGNQGDMLLMKRDLDNSLALNRGSTNQFVAKLFRDMACIQLGMAEGMTRTYHFGSGDPTGALRVLNGGDGPEGRQARYNNGQPRGYDGALNAIALAKQIDPNNPDIPQLEAAAAELQRKLPAVVQRQQSNPIYNPLNVK